MKTTMSTGNETRKDKLELFNTNKTHVQ